MCLIMTCRVSPGFDRIVQNIATRLQFLSEFFSQQKIAFAVFRQSDKLLCLDKEVAKQVSNTCNPSR